MNVCKQYRHYWIIKSMPKINVRFTFILASYN